VEVAIEKAELLTGPSGASTAQLVQAKASFGASAAVKQRARCRPRRRRHIAANTSDDTALDVRSAWRAGTGQRGRRTGGFHTSFASRASGLSDNCPAVGLAAAERYEQAGRHPSSSAFARPRRRLCTYRQSASMAAAPSQPTRQSSTGLFAGRTGALTRWAKRLPLGWHRGAAQALSSWGRRRAARATGDRQD
jgi:hypothetical protein